MLEEFKKAKELIDVSNSIYIVGHVNPDGDAIGSAFATYLALKKIGKNPTVIMQNYSDSFAFLPHLKEAKKDIVEDEIDLLICVDSSDFLRLDLKEEDRNKAKKKIVFDHHKTVLPYGDVNCTDETLPAASEMVYNFLNFANIEIDKEIGTYIYTGLMTDTGSFNYSSTTANTLKAAASMVEKGVDFSYICDKLNHTMKEAKLKLIAKTIENMEVYFDGKCRYSFVSYDIITSLGLNDEDAEGMTNYLRAPEGTLVAVYVRGRSDGTNKVSMRSGGKVDVSEIAIALGGGGHSRAAGYTMKGSLEEEKKKLIEIIGGKIKC